MPARKKKKKPTKAPPKKKVKRTPTKGKVKRTPTKGKVVPTKNGDSKKRGRKAKTVIEAHPQSQVYLRYSAGRDYATDLNLGSIAALAQRPMYKDSVSLDTLTTWSSHDGWVERRRAFIEDLRQREEKAVGTALVQASRAQLAKSQKILDDAFDRLITNGKKQMLEANSWEGAVNAYVKLVQVVEAQRERLADIFLPEPAAALEAQQQQTGLAPVVRPKLSEAEARAAATTIVRMRREEIRAALHAEEREQSPETTTPMRVIEGKK